MKEATVRVLRSTNFRDAIFTPGLPTNEEPEAWLLTEFTGPKHKTRLVVRCIDCPDLLGASVWWLARDAQGPATVAPLHELGAKILAHATSPQIHGEPATLKLRTQTTMTSEHMAARHNAHATQEVKRQTP